MEPLTCLEGRDRGAFTEEPCWFREEPVQERRLYMLQEAILGRQG